MMPTRAPLASARPAISLAHELFGATNSRWYRELGALTDPHPRNRPRSIDLRSHGASGTARVAACVNAGSRPCGQMPAHLVLHVWRERISAYLPRTYGVCPVPGSSLPLRMSEKLMGPGRRMAITGPRGTMCSGD